MVGPSLLCGINVCYRTYRRLDTRKKLLTKPPYFDRAPFSTEEPACKLVLLSLIIEGNLLPKLKKK